MKAMVRKGGGESKRGGEGDRNYTGPDREHVQMSRTAVCIWPKCVQTAAAQSDVQNGDGAVLTLCGTEFIPVF
jgi:hypothetical protein